MLDNGQCVPETSEQCADDELLTRDGECVDPDDFVCDEGTSFDFGAGECISDSEIICGEDTVEADGQCVPEDPISCGEHTVLFRDECLLEETVCGEDTSFDPDELHCYPAPSACDGRTEFDVATGECVDLNVVSCGDDTYELDNQCLPLESFADQLAEDPDLEFGDGTPITPVSDDEVTFVGTMDDELSHSFDVQAEQGDWVEINLYTRGLPSPGFTVEDTDGDWERRVPPGYQAVPSRTVLLPVDTGLELTVTTALADHDDWSGQGHESWKYVGTAEIVDPPVAHPWDDLDEPLSGQLDATTDNWISVDVSETNELILTPHHVGDDAQDPTVELWSDSGDFDQRHSLQVDNDIELDVANHSQVYLHFDAVKLLGEDFDYEVSATVTETLMPGERISVDVTADDGDTLMITHESTDASPVDIDIRFDGQQVQYLTNALAANQGSYDEHESKRSFQYVQNTGTYTVEFVNNSFDEVEGFLGQVTTEEVPVFEFSYDEEDFSADIPGDADPGDWRFVVLDTPAPALVDATIVPSSSSARLSVIEDTTRDRFVNETGTISGTDAQFQTPDAGIYYLVARPWSSITSLGDLEFDVTAQAVEPFEPGEIYEETFDADAFEMLSGEISYAIGDEITVRLFNEDDQLLSEGVRSSSSFRLFELLPSSGEYTLQLENETNEDILGLNVETELIDPVHSFTRSDDFSHSFEQTDSVDDGDSEHILFRPLSAFELDIDVLLDTDESADVRLWRSDNGQVAKQFSASGSSTDAEITVLEGIDYIIEIEATDALGGYEFEFDGVAVDFIFDGQTFDPELLIEPQDEATFTTTVSGCDTLTNLSVKVDLTSAFNQGMYFYLHAPNGETYQLRDGDTGTISTIYPDDTDPVDSFDPLIGESGNGDWSLEIENDASFTDAFLAEWYMEFNCEDD